MEENLVSVIIPVYNADEFIKSTLDSVFNQTYKNIEVIVVDDCSTDNTSSVVNTIAEHYPQLKYYKLDKNFGGPAGPRNYGLRKAKGEFIAFLDSDDIWHYKKLEIQICAIKEHNIDICCSNLTVFTNEESIDTFSSFQEATYDCQEISFWSLKVRNKIPNSSVLIRKSAIAGFYFNESKEYKAVEDYDLWLRLHRAKRKSIKLKVSLMYYRIVEGQISGSKFKQLTRVFHLHYHANDSSRLLSPLFTFTHLLGAAYSRYVRGSM